VNTWTQLRSEFSLRLPAIALKNSPQGNYYQYYTILVPPKNKNKHVLAPYLLNRSACIQHVNGYIDFADLRGTGEQTGVNFYSF
jgi:hypothetical protein